MSIEQNQIVFEDKNEQYGFIQVPTVIATSTVLSPTAVRIYIILRRYASMPKGAMPSVPTICVEAQISKSTYNREIKTFVRSTQNPNPAVPLITAIHRRNATSVFKIHKLTDQLIAKLKPAVMMEETELKMMKAKYKKKTKRKSGYQIETPIENTRESQNETYQSGYQIETPGVSNCDTSYIDNKLYRQTNPACLIDFQTKKEAEKFITQALKMGTTIKSVQATKKRYLEARAKGIDPEQLLSALEETFERYGSNTSPVSVIQTVLENRVAAEEAAKAAAEEREARRKEQDEYENNARAQLIAAGIDPKEVGF